MDRLRYGIAVVLVMGMPPGVGWWFLVHPFVGFWRRIGPGATFTLLTTFLLGSAAGLFLARDLLVRGDLGTRWPLIALAAGLVVAAGAIQRSRRRHLRLPTLVGLPEVAPGRGGRLLTEGIYGRIRHPRYVEWTLAVAGWSLVANYASVYALTALTVLALAAVVPLEERELRQRFGREYDDYCRRVPRFLPRRAR
jgi:protein-S-isoprenylcysteine O-methyltransferase Ste14